MICETCGREIQPGELAVNHGGQIACEKCPPPVVPVEAIEAEDETESDDKDPVKKTKKKK